MGVVAAPLFGAVLWANRASGQERAPDQLKSDQPKPDLALHADGVVAQHGMVVAQEARAARIGVEILQKGGNAVDAAVAVGFAMAVTYPRAGNIGGGGFMMIHRASGKDTAIDYRETAPQAIDATSFLDAPAMPTRKNRATRRSPSACPAPSRAWRWPSKNTARAISRSPN